MKRFSLGIISLLFLAFPVWAVEKSAGLKDALWQGINLAILFFVFYKFGKKPIKEYLENRQRAIAASIAEARKAQEEAEATFRQYQEKLARISQEAEEVYQRLSAEGEMEKERIIAEARRGAERLLADASLISQYELDKARAALRQETAQLAIQLAETRITSYFQDADQERLVADFLEKVRPAR